MSKIKLVNGIILVFCVLGVSLFVCSCAKSDQSVSSTKGYGGEGGGGEGGHGGGR